MLTIEQILKDFTPQCFDYRDLKRLLEYIPIDKWGELGAETNSEVDLTNQMIKILSRENILEELKSDVSFGFEKALNQRGLSASLMYNVVKMWLWILEDELYQLATYPMYGLPLFKAVALKYEFNNPIGDDDPSSPKFMTEYWD